jgi:hypothetical protein
MNNILSLPEVRGPCLSRGIVIVIVTVIYAKIKLKVLLILHQKPFVQKKKEAVPMISVFVGFLSTKWKDAFKMLIFINVLILNNKF